jgi:hypothetical protein
MERFALAQRMALAVMALAVAACGGDLTLPGPGMALRIVGGNGQRGTVGEELPAKVVVALKTDGGAPVPGQTVAFTSDNPADRFDPESTVTNNDGEAFTRWVLGTEPGTYTAEARVVTTGDTALTSAPLHADAVAGAPDTLRALGQTTRGGSRGQPLDEALTVMVVDRYGNPVAGALVDWRTSDGNSGSLSATQTETGADGTASVTWTLGGRIGVQRAEARIEQVNGSPVTFTAVSLF